MNRAYLSAALERLNWLVLSLFAFLVPVFFLPITSEFYEFNKSVLLIGAASVLLVIWALRSYFDGKISLVHTPVDVPILVFWAFFALSTLFSVDRYVSFAGYYPRFHPSFLTVTSLTVLFFAVTASNLTKGKVRLLVSAVTLSTSVAAFAQLASYFGVWLSNAQWMQVRSWNPEGSPNNLAFVEAIVLPLSVGLLATGKSKIRFVWVVAYLLMLSSLASMNVTFGWVMVATSVVLALVFAAPDVIAARRRYAPFAVIPALIVLLFVVQPLRDNLIGPLVQHKNTQLPAGNQLDVPLEPMLPQNFGWATAASTLRGLPFLGSGPATFLYDFTRNKPLEVNQTNFWNLRFDRPSSDFVGNIATLGIIGFAAWIVTVLFIARTNLSLLTKSNTEDNLHKFIAISTLAALVGQFFGTSPIAASSIFFLTTAALYSVWGRELAPSRFSPIALSVVAARSGIVKVVEEAAADRPSSGTQVLSSAFVVAAALVVLVNSVALSKAYAAEVSYQKSLVAIAANRGQDAYNAQVQAINQNPNRDLYHRSLAATNLALARSISQKQQPSDADKQTVTQLVGQAINEGKITTGYQVRAGTGTSALNVANWEILSQVYQNLIGISSGSETHATNTLGQALALDPLNVRLNEVMGTLLNSIGDRDGAVRFYEDAIRVKPDYASAHYNLAQVLKAKGDNPVRAAVELQTVLNLLPQNDPNRDRVQKEYDEAKVKADEAIKKAQEDAKNRQTIEATQSAKP